jgi:uncharacterized protein (TIRG00374 family)
MRKLFVILVLFLAASLVILSFSELRTLVETLRHAHWMFLLLGILLECVFVWLEGVIFWSLYRLVGLKDSPWRLFLIAVAANFVNIVAPSAGIGWVATWVDHGRRNNQPAARITLAATLYLLLDYLAFMVILASGFIVLIRRQNLQWGEVIAAFLLMGVILTLTALLYFAYRAPHRSGTLLRFLARVVNALLRPILHRNYLNEERALQFAEELHEGLQALPSRRELVLLPFSLALLAKLVLIGILMCTFLSFSVPFSAGTLLAGFSLGYLFLIVSPTPSGIGFMEGALALALNSLRVEWSQAALITLTYRGITFWLPFVFGAWVFRHLNWES